MTHAPDAVCGTLLPLGTHALDTVHGRFAARAFLDLSTQRLALALCRGAVRAPAPLLARVHSSCMTSETFAGCDCDCAGQLDAALAAIARHGRGVVFYLMQEGRGAGFVAKARDRMMVQASGGRVTTFDAYARMGLADDHRRYDEVGFARTALGITAPLRVLTGNPDKVVALRVAGVPIAEVLPLARQPSPFNRQYLAAKGRRGHAVHRAGGRAAALPEAVEYFEPHRLVERPRFVRAASYLLPIRPSRRRAAHWFRVHAYLDLLSGRERVLLTYARDRRAVPLVRLQREALLERIPLRRGAVHAPRWRAAVEAIVRRGAGCALFLLHDDPVAAAGVERDEDLAWLLAQHVGGPRAQFLLDRRDGGRQDAAVAGTLARHGVDCLAAAALDRHGGHGRA